MNNAFTKLAFNIMSRLGRNAAAKSSFGAKAKAGLGLAGLAGAGALAHHYDILAPKKAIRSVAEEMANSNIAAKLDSPTKPLVETAEALKYNKYITDKFLVQLGLPQSDEVRSLLHRSQSKVMDIGGLSGDDLVILRDGKLIPHTVAGAESLFSPGNSLSGSKNMLDALIASRDVAAHGGRPKEVINTLNNLIDEHAKVLNETREPLSVVALEGVYNNKVPEIDHNYLLGIADNAYRGGRDWAPGLDSSTIPIIPQSIEHRLMGPKTGIIMPTEVFRYKFPTPDRDRLARPNNTTYPLGDLREYIRSRDLGKNYRVGRTPLARP
jgi:hypothetical protein